MSDQNDMDIDNDLDDFDDAGFGDYGKKGTLGDLWNNNPYVKVGIIVAAFVFIVAGIILFGGRADQAPASRVSGGSDLTEAPGSSEISQAYRTAIEETNQAQTEQAIREDSSVIPMPVAPALGTIPQTLEPQDVEDPLDRWRRLQEERIAQQQLVTPEPAPAQPQVDTRTPAVNALTSAMATQMESVLSVQAIKGPLIKNITNMEYLETIERRRAERQYAQQQAQAYLTAQGAERIAEILVPAGTIEYAQLITEANTDAPGPVLAQIQSGPLKGARVLGSFTNTEEFLTLNFNMVVIDGVNQTTSAVALDPGTTLPGMVTDKDQRYWKRVVLPAAAAFVEGLAEAVANSDKTTITIIGDSTSQTTTTGSTSRDQSVASGIEEAGSRVADIISEEAARTRPMLKIRAGTPIGILFVTPVLEYPIPTQMLPSDLMGGTLGMGQSTPYFAPAGQQGTPQFNPYLGVMPQQTSPNFFSNSGSIHPVGQN